MPTYRRQLKRYEHEGHLRFLTCSCYQRLALFNNDAIKDRFAEQLSVAQSELGFRLHAWVVMPEHIHLLLQPENPEQTVAAILRRIKAGFAQRVIQRWKELDAPILERIADPQGKLRFWQHGSGYDRNIFSQEEYEEKIAYIHTNPVRRDLAQHPGDWRWSSSRFYEPCGRYRGPAITPIA